MRFLAKITIPLEKADDAFKSGDLPRTLQSAMQRLRPEAAYFFEEDGKRECIFVFNLDVAALLKPLFPDLDAAFHVTPVMNAAEFELELSETAVERQPTQKPDLLTDISPTASEAPEQETAPDSRQERGRRSAEPGGELATNR